MLLQICDIIWIGKGDRYIATVGNWYLLPRFEERKQENSYSSSWITIISAFDVSLSSSLLSFCYPFHLLSFFSLTPTISFSIFLSTSHYSFLCLSVYLPLSLSVNLPLSLSLNLFLSTSHYFLIPLSVYLILSLSVYLPLFLMLKNRVGSRQK